MSHTAIERRGVHAAITRVVRARDGNAGEEDSAERRSRELRGDEERRARKNPLVDQAVDGAVAMQSDVECGAVLWLARVNALTQIDDANATVINSRKNAAQGEVPAVGHGGLGGEE